MQETSQETSRGGVQKVGGVQETSKETSRGGVQKTSPRGFKKLVGFKRQVKRQVVVGFKRQVQGGSKSWWGSRDK